jgi:hypothetical protein
MIFSASAADSPKGGSKCLADHDRRHGLSAHGTSRQGGKLDLHRVGKGVFPRHALYDPDKPLFDRTWKLPDLEQVSNP